MTCQGVFIGTNSSRTEVYRVIIMFKCEDRFQYLSWVSFRPSWGRLFNTEMPRVTEASQARERAKTNSNCVTKKSWYPPDQSFHWMLFWCYLMLIYGSQHNIVSKKTSKEMYYLIEKPVPGISRLWWVHKK